MSSTCSTVSRQLDEPVAGTAATARTWLLLEQPGPWGAKALTSSHLDRALGRALEQAAHGTGVRIALIRRAGRHADRRVPVGRQVYAAHTVPGNVWLHAATVTDPAHLLDLDFGALGRGEPGTFGTALGGSAHESDPLALVCTNGRRDRCCAVLGRPLASELAASGVEGVWEVTHLGGHRFAPTVLVRTATRTAGSRRTPSRRCCTAHRRAGSSSTDAGAARPGNVRGRRQNWPSGARWASTPRRR